MYAPPVPSETTESPIRIADWIELNLVTREEELISQTSVIDALTEAPPDDAAVSEHREEYAFDPEDLDPDELTDGYWKDAERSTELAFLELCHRAEWLGISYPFCCNDDTASLNSNFESERIATFLTLLRSRHLYYEALQDDGNTAGELFEELVPHALRCYVGTIEECALRFGMAGGSRGDGLPNNTDDAIIALAQRTNEARGSLSNLSSGQDFGGDAIVWKPFGDSLPGQLVAVAQSTISERKWIRKQPSPKWRNRRLIQFLSVPLTVVAFVETLSLTSRTFLDGLSGEFSSMPFDRLRLLQVLRDGDLPTSLLTRMDAWSCSMCARLAQ